MTDECQNEPHEHVAENGLLVKCYHHCRHHCVNVFGSANFWIGMTVGFPFEHWLWTKVPGFMWVSQHLRLM